MNREEEIDYYKKLLVLQEDFLGYSMINFLESISDRGMIFGSQVRGTSVWLVSIRDGRIVCSDLSRNEIKAIVESPFLDFLCFMGEDDAKIFVDLFGEALKI